VDGLPTLVRDARARASRSGFEYSCDDGVGNLLAVLAASVPADGRILELGTGAGVGTAWIVHGVAGRADVEVVTVEVDPARSASARSASWPPSLRFLVGDAVALLPSLGRFDLIFADAPGGKWEGLDLTVDALRHGGFLLVDDMTPTDRWDAHQVTKQSEVRDQLHRDPALVTCDLEWATGLVLCVRTRSVPRVRAPSPIPG